MLQFYHAKMQECPALYTKTKKHRI